MLSETQTRKICDKVLSLSKKGQTEVLLDCSNSALTRYANNTIHQNVAEKDITISVRVILGKKVGRATTNRLDDKSLKNIVERAHEAAKVQKEDNDLLPLISGQRYQKADGFVKKTAGLSPADRAEGVASVVKKCKSRRLSASGIFSNDDSAVAIANSKGLFAFHRATEAECSVTVQTDDSSGWAEDSNKDVKKLDPPKLGDIAIDKALRSKKPRSIPPGEYTVVLEPAATTDFLLFLSHAAFSAQDLQDGTSFLSGKIGQKVFGDNITITDDAYHPLTTGIPFDFEGAPRNRVVLVEKGVAKGCVYDRKTAKKDGCKTTGHALPQPNPHGPMPLNLILSEGDSSLDEMIATTDKGILATHFHYTNLIDPMRMTLTGMTRDGTFLVEKGEISCPVKNMRFTESIIKALSNVERISRERVFASGFFGGGFVVPAMKIHNFTFSSETEF